MVQLALSFIAAINDKLGFHPEQFAVMKTVIALVSPYSWIRNEFLAGNRIGGIPHLHTVYEHVRWRSLPANW